MRDLTRCILQACAQPVPPEGLAMAADEHGTVKVTVKDMAALRPILPPLVWAELLRTGGRTGLTLDLDGNLVWEYGLRIVVDRLGLKTVHSWGRHANHHAPDSAFRPAW